MTVIEYGQQNDHVILLLHGGGLSWWNYREAAKILSAQYHVVLPVLDGHADSAISMGKVTIFSMPKSAEILSPADARTT